MTRRQRFQAILDYFRTNVPVAESELVFDSPTSKKEKAPRCLLFFGDPWESRTPDWGVRGPRLDHLTIGP